MGETIARRRVILGEGGWGESSETEKNCITARPNDQRVNSAKDKLLSQLC